MTGGMASPHGSLDLENIERQALVDALHRSGGNKKKAAELLGIHRPTLYNKLKRLGLSAKEET